MITRPYGSWTSAISAQSLVQDSLRLGQIQLDGHSIYWTEGRPTERGRTALMKWESGAALEINNREMDVRTRAHEYGGGAFLCNNGLQFFVNNADQQIYQTQTDGPPRQITDAPDHRFADLILDAQRQVLIAVGESHADPATIDNYLLNISLRDGSMTTLANGHDFYSNPRLSPDGLQLLYLTWDHPRMPWDGTELHLAQLDSHGMITNETIIAGGEDESIFQPLWDPDGSVYFVSDRRNWWNIYHYNGGITRSVLEMDAEFGLPQWVFGMSRYAVLASGDLIACCSNEAGSQLFRINVAHGTSREVRTPYAVVDQLQGHSDQIVFIGQEATQPAAVVTLDLETHEFTPLRHATTVTLDPDKVSIPENIQFQTAPNEDTHAWYYPPTNPDFQAPAGDLPPLIVLSHGGPTGQSHGTFNMTVQYWTSRGFAVMDVNYSGSTGYGRKYRQRLRGQWGIRDVHDCATAARYLAEEQVVDPEKLIIKGGSAGGFTTLAALAFTDVFKAGASYYGIGDLLLLAEDTHKFERHYLDSLIGPYPEQKQLYSERSPRHFADQFTCPVIFMQGREDKVVPPSQVEGMITALKSENVPVAYLSFEGEAHGFRRAETIVRAIESEYSFYCQVFGLEPGEVLPPVKIIG